MSQLVTFCKKQDAKTKKFLFYAAIDGFGFGHLGRYRSGLPGQGEYRCVNVGCKVTEVFDEVRGVRVEKKRKSKEQHKGMDGVECKSAWVESEYDVVPVRDVCLKHWPEMAAAASADTSAIEAPTTVVVTAPRDEEAEFLKEQEQNRTDVSTGLQLTEQSEQNISKLRKGASGLLQVNTKHMARDSANKTKIVKLEADNLRYRRGLTKMVGVVKELQDNGYMPHRDLVTLATEFELLHVASGGLSPTRSRHGSGASNGSGSGSLFDGNSRQLGGGSWY